MATRLGALAPRVIGVVLVLLFASATFTFAASQQAPAPAPTPAAAAPQTSTLVVPDVTGQAYVFAKGMLEDAGFAWRLAPGSKGYAAARVVAQFPKRGVEVVNTGAPTLVLKLQASPKYHRGTRAPDQASPYAGTPLRLAHAPALPKPKAKAKVKTHKVTPAAKPKSTPKPVAPAPKSTPQPRKQPAPARPPAFTVAGAPKEPLDEMSLPDRARLLATWVGAHDDSSASNVNHWL